MAVLDHLERNLVLDLLDTEAGRRFVLDDEALDLVIAEIARPDDGEVAPRGIPDPTLLAIQDPGVALALRRRQQAAAGARANQRLRQAETADLFEACHRRQPFLLLLFRSINVDGPHRQADMHANEGGARWVDACELHLNKAQQCQASTCAAVALHCKPND